MTAKTLKQTAAERRDKRHTKEPAEVRSSQRGKKNTKRWCKGKIGREHKPKCFSYRPGTLLGTSTIPLYVGWYTLACEVCGRELDHYWPMRVENNPQPKPAWVTEGS